MIDKRGRQVKPYHAPRCGIPLVRLGRPGTLGAFDLSHEIAMHRLFNLLTLAALAALALVLLPHGASAEPTRVLWFLGTPDYPGEYSARERRAMARYIDNFGSGTDFTTTFVRSTRRGALAAEIDKAAYDILVLDVATTSNVFGSSDLTALKGHYARGHRGLMLDGSLGIRNMVGRALTRFPGPDDALGKLLVNQMTALAQAGGGILIGTDHDQWQRSANSALGALLPGAEFKGSTNPSTDGVFLGTPLLQGIADVVPVSVLRHWESVPNQGEAPVGAFTDFEGQPVTLWSLVETADKPGGGRKRPYISASFDPGDAEYDIDSEVAPEPKLPDNMPTRKGPTR